MNSSESLHLELSVPGAKYLTSIKMKSDSMNIPVCTDSRDRGPGDISSEDFHS